MKKYSASITNNNKLKDEVLGQLKTLIYKLEKGKYNEYLDKEQVKDVLLDLKESANGFENCVGTGKEDVAHLAEAAMKQVKDLSKQSEQDLFTRFQQSANTLDYTIELWTSVLNGEGAASELVEDPAEKVSWAVKRLNGKLAELDEIKTGFRLNESRLEKDIISLEKDLNELDDAMANEENERRINQLYRKISAITNKLEMLNAHKEQYSACFNTLDLIYENAREIIKESTYSADDLGKARALLNINRLKLVMNEPEKAISILKRMQKETEEIKEHTKTLDSKVFGLGAENIGSGAPTIAVNDKALAYKEALMKKRQAKEEIAKAKKDLDDASAKSVKTTDAEKVKVEGDK